MKKKKKKKKTRRAADDAEVKGGKRVAEDEDGSPPDRRAFDLHRRNFIISDTRASHRVFSVSDRVRNA